MKKLLASFIGLSLLVGMGMAAPKTKLAKCCLKKQACCKMKVHQKCCPVSEKKS